MIHELIDPKKKSNKTGSFRNTKTLQENKTAPQQYSLEPKDIDDREAETSSTTFMPPWLRNSLGLNQKNNQRHIAGGQSDQKSGKIIQRFKETHRDEFESLKSRIEDDCSKKESENLVNSLQQCRPQEKNSVQAGDEIEVFDFSCDRTAHVKWNAARQESDIESGYINGDARPLEKKDSKLTICENAALAKDDEKKKTKFIRQKYKLRKRALGDSKFSDSYRNESLAEAKAVECLGESVKEEVLSVSAEMKQLEAKLLLITAKGHNTNNYKLNQQEFRLLQEKKEEKGKISGELNETQNSKEFHFQENVDCMVSDSKNKIQINENKDEKNLKDVAEKCNENETRSLEKDIIFSTDEENDIKRFSEFLSKNRNIEEKRRCLEEVRNYFEKKRKMQMGTNPHFSPEGKPRQVSEMEKKEEETKNKIRCKEVVAVMSSRGRKRTKFALCDEEVMERAVDETLQKFVEMYHFRVPPTVMGNMKKNILQAMQHGSVNCNSSKSNVNEVWRKPIETEASNSDLPRQTEPEDLSKYREKSPSKPEFRFIHKGDISDIFNRDSVLQKEVKKKILKSFSENSSEQAQKQLKETEANETEKLNRLKKDFENFLYSVQNHVDLTNLKLRSVVLEKEDQNLQSKRSRFVYNFTKKMLEPEKPEQQQAHKETHTEDYRNYNTIGVQAVLKKDNIKRSVKVQVTELTSTADEHSQGSEKSYLSQITQTDLKDIIFRKVKQIKSFDVSPGLYRMVTSREAGKFYLYPEQSEDCGNSSSASKEGKTGKKKNSFNVLPKNKFKDKLTFRRESGKLKKKKKSLHTLTHLKRIPSGKAFDREKNKDSLNCLYFRNLEDEVLEPPLSEIRKDLAKETSPVKEENDLELGDVKDRHLGCFWFWNGQKISPGCDLKAHVERLVKEKLKEITKVDTKQNKMILDIFGFPNDIRERSLLNTSDSQKDFTVKNPNADGVEFESTQKESSSTVTNNKRDLRINKKLEQDSQENGTSPICSREKKSKNVGIQNSLETIPCSKSTRSKTQNKFGVPAKAGRKKFKKKKLVLNSVPGKFINYKKAEDLIRAIEEIKKLGLKIEHSRKENSVDTESILGSTTSSTLESRNISEGPFPVLLGLKTNSKENETQGYNVKSKLNKMINFVENETRGTDVDDFETRASLERCGRAASTESQKHLELIENVLGSVSQREREALWNDVRDFIKSKIGRDINDEGAREVCIEIEQDMPENEKGMVKQAVMARGHYTREAGDVEVEIDLTMDDLERILRQRRKKIRWQQFYHKKYNKYLRRFAVLEGTLLNRDRLKSLRKKRDTE